MYVQIDEDYFGHPKTLTLMSLIGPEADVYPVRLWTWVMKYAPSGVLKSKAYVEIACHWKGKAEKLAQAMIEAGFMEDDGVTLHGWEDYTGGSIARYEQKKERMRDYMKVKQVGENGQVTPPTPIGDVAARLAVKWNDGPGEHTSTARNKIQAALDVGVKAQDIEQVFWDDAKIKGRKIWEVLDPLRPEANGSSNAYTLALEIEKERKEKKVKA